MGHNTWYLHMVAGYQCVPVMWSWLLRCCAAVEASLLMDRRLQSSLDKKTRVGWQTRVYRLERGYLSGWADVSSAAAQEEPSRVICLFQGDQVATLSDQGIYQRCTEEMCVYRGNVWTQTSPAMFVGMRTAVLSTDIRHFLSSCFACPINQRAHVFTVRRRWSEDLFPQPRRAQPLLPSATTIVFY